MTEQSERMALNHEPRPGYAWFLVIISLGALLYLILLFFVPDSYWENGPGFFAAFGFLAVIGFMYLAKAWRVVVKRDEEYYDRCAGSELDRDDDRVIDNEKEADLKINNQPKKEL
ncbi:hypothetical protein JXQ70_17070 [bacterium]|nr:hypothetical protein [bacterium]